ncbi:MAG: ATP-binding protein [Desulfobacterales bacterium]|nr:ATP-binding protein [Desulfobacterales bacterium]
MKIINTYKKHRVTLRQKAIASIFLTYVFLTLYVFYFVFFMKRPIVHEGMDMGQIHMIINTVEVNRRLARITYWGIPIFIGTILSGLLLTYFLERRMRGSLKKLIQTTRHMAQGDLSRRVEIAIGDEVEELGESFNQMAQSLAEKERQLIMARNTLVSIFNGITAGIAYISSDYEIIQANHAYNDLMKNVTGSSLAKGGRCFELFGQEQDICMECPGKVAMKTGKPENLEREIMLKNGEKHVLWIHAYPVQDAENITVGFVEYIIDISHQRKLEDDLKTYTEHLEEIVQERTHRLKEAQTQIAHQEKMVALGQMVAGVAHEINNPNGFITHNVPILEETWQMFEPLVSDYATAHSERQISGFHIAELCRDMRESIQEIKIGSDRINKIVSNLKAFVRLDQNLKVKPIDVNAVIEKTLEIVGAQVRKSVGEVKMKLDPNLPIIQGYFQKLEQVMVNLIINAIQAVPEKNKGKLSIRTRHVARLGSVLIEIEDNGIGMEAKVIEHIFEPFFTTWRDAGGTGLGLSVSYSLIREHNGIIGVLSRPGLGTRFTLYLPVDGKKKLRISPSILCLDDDAEILGLLRMHYIEVQNMAEEIEIKPESVVEYLKGHPEVDIVLLDIMMPMINGCDLIEKIKVEFPLLAIIPYSGNASKVKTFKQKPNNVLAADYFLQKPVKMEQLLEIINTIGRQRL